MQKYIYKDKYIRYISMYLYIGKVKKEAQVIFLNPFQANGSLSFVSLFPKKQTEVVRLQMD